MVMAPGGWHGRWLHVVHVSLQGHDIDNVSIQIVNVIHVL